MNLNKLSVVEISMRPKFERSERATKLLTYNNVLAGVEIELENLADPKGSLYMVQQAGWREMPEGSLVNGHEFAMYPPRNGMELRRTIDKFFNAGFEWTTGERTSIHIHVDMLDGTTIGQMRAIVALTYALEPAIYRVADENRKWASYSCPLSDMTPERMAAFFSTTSAGSLQRAMKGVCHEDKYFGCNLVSVRKHGTLEFRYFPCTTYKTTLMKWLNICIELKIAGSLFNNIQEMERGLNSEHALLQFMKDNMPVAAEALAPYIDAAEAVQRIREVAAIAADEVARPINPFISAALQAYLDRNKTPGAVKKAEKDVLQAGDEVNVADLADLLRKHQAAIRQLGGLHPDADGDEQDDEEF